MENLSYRHHIGNEPLKYLTLGQLAEQSASRYGQIVAVESLEQNSKLTYLELLNEADKFAAGLRKLGMEKGNRLGLWVPNCREWFVVNLACMRAGLIAVLLNPANGMSEIEYSINNTGIKIIICPYEGKHNKFYENLMKLEPELDKGGKVTNTRIPSLKAIILISEEHIQNTHSYQEVFKIANCNEIAEIRMLQCNIRPDDPCYIHFSSGTTTKPKAVLLTHFQVVNNSYVLSKRNEFDRKHHIMCSAMPLFHVAGSILSAATAVHFGTAVVIPSLYYNPEKNLIAIKDRKCSFILGAPTVYIDLIKIQQNAQAALNLEIAVIGGASFSPDLCSQMKKVLNLRTVKLSYGLTEASAVIFYSVPEEKECYYETVGYIVDHVQVKIIDEDDNMLPIGQVGEICVRGYVVMAGYWEDEENTKNVLKPDGWLRTGDVGILGCDGYLKVVGRVTDVIIRGGENLYPKEIEDFISTHPSVLEVNVIGIPHERLGEEVCACLILKNGSSLTKAQLFEFCKGNIAHQKIPTKIIVQETFPKTSSGKIMKRLLKEQICSGLHKIIQ